MAATVKLHKTTRDDSEKHEGSGERRRDEIGEGNKQKGMEREERERRGGKGGEGEQTAQRASAKEGGN
jgi:hypothetical protein